MKTLISPILLFSHKYIIFLKGLLSLIRKSMPHFFYFLICSQTRYIKNLSFATQIKYI
jgi:hypothetical protein